MTSWSYAKASGDVNHPRLLKPLPPTPLDGKPMSLESTDDRRVHFADWLMSPKNSYFSRSLGQSRVGQLHGPRPGRIGGRRARHQSGFERRTVRRAERRFRGQRLRREAPDPDHHELGGLSAFRGCQRRQIRWTTKYYSKYFVKRLPAEVLLDVMSQVTGVPTRFGGYPVGRARLQLPDMQVQSEFLTSFGRPKRIICDAGERSSEPNIAQALHVINGDTLNKKLSDGEWLCGAGGEAGAFATRGFWSICFCPPSAAIRPKPRSSRCWPRCARRARRPARRRCSAKRIARRWKT